MVQKLEICTLLPHNLNSFKVYKLEICTLLFHDLNSHIKLPLWESQKVRNKNLIKKRNLLKILNYIFKLNYIFLKYIILEFKNFYVVITWCVA